MAIYKKGSDLGPLVKAAEEQKSARSAAGAAGRKEAGLAPISNGMLRPDGSGYQYDYSKKEKPIVPLEERSVSGSVVAERRAYLERKEPGSTAAPKIGNQSAGPKNSSGVIKKRVLQDKSSPAPKKKSATQGDVKKALKGGKITAEEAADLNPALMKPSVKVKK
jgi:hypothetical protein